jgi:hypothetical protein
MRNLPSRPELAAKTVKKLQAKTQVILNANEGEPRKKVARKLFDQARQTDWFEPVVNALKSISGIGELCMYCSANEPSQVEHYRPLAVFPGKAMTYENYLWCCDICNRNYKGQRFPPDTGPGAQILNPIDDNVWHYFFLDERFGRLIQCVDPDTAEALPRAVSTCSVVGIDRETLQIRRQHRYASLRRDVEQTLADMTKGTVSTADAQRRLTEWRSAPFQADVADYFLNGPGRAIEPFRSLLEAVGDVSAAKHAYPG